MTKRPYDPDLKTEIGNLIQAGEAFKKRQAERQRQREETARKMDAAILMNDPLPPDAA
tara:strand:- start:1343 stop:1516 length:174 start_codon:yes stop_codon:yes gene_type:complete